MKHYHPIFWLLVLGFLTSCSPLKQYRDHYQTCINQTEHLAQNCQRASLQQLPDANASAYHLNFIEFDDQGQLWDRQQMWQVLTQLTAQAAKRDLLMLVFVHGWTHSAEPNDQNIATFNRVLAQINQDEQQLAHQQQRPARAVAGVYLAWRGGSVPVPLLENLTFWERKNTAEKVGHGDVAEVLSRLEQLRLDKNALAPSNTGTRLVVIGHSFGAALVQSALAQILENRFVRSTGPLTASDVDGFGNLVVLINPAIEAARFSSLSDMSIERGHYFANQLPVLLILTSEADNATKIAFSAGRRLSTLFELERAQQRYNATTGQTETIQQDLANVTAIGHFAPYRTHRLEPSAQQPLHQPPTLANLALIQQQWQQDRPQGEIYFPGSVLKHQANSAGRNPYLVVQVSRELIPDHNQIDDPRILEFIRQLLLLSMEPRSNHGE